MSAKESFFKKVKENKSNQEEFANKIRSDIGSFRNKMFELTKDIDMWLHGSGVEVVISEVPFNDGTISAIPGIESLSNYKSSVCRMKNGSKTALLQPEGIYGGENKGWASLTIETPERHPATQRFLLRVRSDDSWVIKKEYTKQFVSKYDEKDLTESSFFEAIESLA